MFSIIIPTCNRALILGKTLKQTGGMRRVNACEIIIVDDGSTDETPAVVKAFEHTFPGTLRYRRQANQGPGTARNLGLGIARFPRVLFLDDDVAPEPDLIEKHAGFLDQGYDLSQGTLKWHPGIQDDPLIRFMDRRGMQFVNNDTTTGASAHFSYANIYTANLAADKSKILAAKGFDDALSVQRYAFEDTVLGYQLYRNGVRMGLNIRAKAIHYHPQTPASLIAREFKIGFSAAILELRYPEIFTDLNFHHTTRCAALQHIVLSCLPALNHSGPTSPCFDLVMRIRLRKAFIKGYQTARASMSADSS